MQPHLGRHLSAVILGVPREISVLFAPCSRILLRLLNIYLSKVLTISYYRTFTVCFCKIFETNLLDGREDYEFISYARWVRHSLLSTCNNWCLAAAIFLRFLFFFLSLFVFFSTTTANYLVNVMKY